MSNWANNKTKTSASTPSNVAKNTASAYGYIKSGQSPYYDSKLTYDGDTPQGQRVNYDSIGQLPTFTNKAKN